MTMRKWVRVPLKGAAIMLAVAALGIGSVVAHQRITGNLHAVVPGELYRAGQPSAGQLAAWIDRYGIRTVINLRGANPGKGWYDGEVAVTAAKGVAHVDVRMKSSTLLTSDQAHTLIAAMMAAEKPVLIHCEAGADRTGLAAALYLAAVAKAGEEAAERQLSYLYGHISVWPSQGRHMSLSFEALEPELGFPDS